MYHLDSYALTRCTYVPPIPMCRIDILSPSLLHHTPISTIAPLRRQQYTNDMYVTTSLHRTGQISTTRSLLKIAYDSIRIFSRFAYECALKRARPEKKRICVAPIERRYRDQSRRVRPRYPLDRRHISPPAQPTASMHQGESNAVYRFSSFNFVREVQASTHRSRSTLKRGRM